MKQGKNQVKKPEPKKTEIKKPEMNMSLILIVMAVVLAASLIGNAVQAVGQTNASRETQALRQELASTNSKNIVMQDELLAAKEQLENLGKKASDAQVDTASAQKKPVVTIEMEDGGIIKLELYPDKAPNTVKSFVSLAQSGFYDGVIFHRVIDGFMIQGGDPDGTGMGGPGYRIKAEFANAGFTQNDISHQAGVISMARQGNQYDPASAYDTAGSQFFICDGDASFLDGDYTAFGKVTEGMDVVERISAVQTDASDRPLQEQKMKRVTVDTLGEDLGAPETIPGN